MGTKGQHANSRPPKPLIGIHDIIFDVNMVIYIGSSSEIYTSKVIKITLVSKNHDQNGSRVDFCASNAHSNGDFFLGLLYFSSRLYWPSTEFRNVTRSVLVTPQLSESTKKGWCDPPICLSFLRSLLWNFWPYLKILPSGKGGFMCPRSAGILLL